MSDETFLRLRMLGPDEQNQDCFSFCSHVIQFFSEKEKPQSALTQKLLSNF